MMHLHFSGRHLKQGCRIGVASLIPAKVLKGKNPQRVFWAVVTLENMDEIKAAIEEAAE